jgi:hypothetical protein
MKGNPGAERTAGNRKESVDVSFFLSFFLESSGGSSH